MKMCEIGSFPVLDADLEAIKENAAVMNRFCADKPSAPGGERKNWSGRMIECEDRGVRTRAIAALGSLDTGDPSQLIPLDPGMSIIGGSSDHTIIDVTDSGRDLSPGDTVSFRMNYVPLLYCFSIGHVRIEYR